MSVKLYVNDSLYHQSVNIEVKSTDPEKETLDYALWVEDEVLDITSVITDNSKYPQSSEDRQALSVTYFGIELPPYSSVHIETECTNLRVTVSGGPTFPGAFK